jgi:hypothetical protein
MRYAPRWIAAVVLGCVPVLTVAACSSTSGTAESPTTAATSGSPIGTPAVASPAETTTGAPRPTTRDAGKPKAVTVIRSGGIAGVMQVLQIAPDGAWTLTDKRSNRVQRGSLTEAQRAQLARLLADPALAAESRRAPPAGQCADAFVYAVTVGELSFRFEQCGDAGNRPRIDAVLNLILDVTPM